MDFISLYILKFAILFIKNLTNSYKEQEKQMGKQKYTYQSKQKKNNSVLKEDARKCKKLLKKQQFSRFIHYFEHRRRVSTIPFITQYQLNKFKIQRPKLFQKPFKIKLEKFPNFQYPQKLQIQITKAEPKNDENQQKLIQIDYNSDEETVYLQIPSQQFLLKVKQGYFLKSSYQVSIPQMKLQKESYQIPTFVSTYFNKVKSKINSVNLWYYCGQRLTRWHYDGHDNFLFQKYGTKIIRLREPNTLKTISNIFLKQKNSNIEKYLHCNSIFNLNNNHLNQSQIDIDSNEIKSIKVLLRKNECLFIPRGWFHQVHSLPDNRKQNVAVNYWGNTIGMSPQIKDDQVEMHFKEMTFGFTQKLCKKSVQGWQQLNQELKTKFRKAYFHKYLSIMADSQKQQVSN